MKLRATPLILVLISMSCNVFSITMEHYQHLCGQPEKLTLQGKRICNAHQARIRSHQRYNQEAKAGISQNAPDPSTYVIYDSQQKKTTAPPKRQPISQPKPKRSLNSKERREQLKFTPYTPGAFNIVKKEEKDES